MIHKELAKKSTLNVTMKGLGNSNSRGLGNTFDSVGCGLVNSNSKIPSRYNGPRGMEYGMGYYNQVKNSVRPYTDNKPYNNQSRLGPSR